MKARYEEGNVDDKSYCFWTERVPGVTATELSAEDYTKIVPQIQEYVDKMQKLESTVCGGPTGLLCAPALVSSTYWYNQVSFTPVYAPEGEKFVFCHGDLHCDNIMVDPSTLKITAILDWEYAGFYPKSHEIPYWRKQRGSGAQAGDFQKVKEDIKTFWAKCVVS
jgi:thiamine kinase-like enzyme